MVIEFGSAVVVDISASALAVVFAVVFAVLSAGPRDSFARRIARRIADRIERFLFPSYLARMAKQWRREDAKANRTFNRAIAKSNRESARRVARFYMGLSRTERG